MVEEIAARCPICNGSNQCGNLAGLPAEACWCSKETFPQAIFEQIPPELLGKACVCKACLDRLKATVSDEKPGESNR